MTLNDEVLQKLDRIIAILQIVHKDEIDRARGDITADKVDAAILKAAAKATPAGQLVKSVQTKTKQTKRSVQRHVADLIEQGLLEKSGGGSATAYKATGLI
jgi:hypothetical protein